MPTSPSNPEDYAAINDFGFTAVDAETYNASQAATQQTTTQPVVDQTPATNDTLDRLDGIEANLRVIIDRLSGEEGDGFPAAVTDIERLERKLDEMLQLQTEELYIALSGQSADIRAVIDEVEQRKAQLTASYKTKMNSIEQLVMPLLYNLKKNPEKEYIYWPNRENKIQEQITKILAMTRAEVPL
jgi:hypothetical protein